MRSILTLFAVALAFQALSQPLEMYKTLGGAHFQRDTIYLSHGQVREILSIDPQATEEFKLAVKNYRVGGLLGFSGAILLAIPVVTAIAGGDPEWALAGGGAVLLGVSIPFSKGFKRHAQVALDGFNQRQGYQPQTRAKVYFTGNGFTLKF
ncbi:MAG: hypothetical protein WDO14_08770 [Bacteroidota bacterium]